MIPLMSGAVSQQIILGQPTQFTVNSDGFSNSILRLVSFGSPAYIEYGDGETYTIPADTAVEYIYPAGTFSGTIRKSSGRIRVCGLPLVGVQNIESGLEGIVFYDVATGFNSPALASVPSAIPSSITFMDYMFYSAGSFNQDLSGWCVSNIPIAPTNFDVGATSWVLPRPVWGTCPGG